MHLPFFLNRQWAQFAVGVPAQLMGSLCVMIVVSAMVTVALPLCSPPPSWPAELPVTWLPASRVTVQLRDALMPPPETCARFPVTLAPPSRTAVFGGPRQVRRQRDGADGGQDGAQRSPAAAGSVECARNGVEVLGVHGRPPSPIRRLREIDG
jgi:hypothetical protein